MIGRMTPYKHALQYNGVKESDIEGNAIIVRWIKRVLTWWDGHSSGLAWCAIFMAIMVIDTLGKEFVPDKPYRARNWGNAGRKVHKRDARKGDIVVYTRGNPNSGKGHVNFLEEFVTGKNGIRYVKGYGGNQSDEVNSTWRKESTVLHYIRLDLQVIPMSKHKRSFITKILLKRIKNV